MRKADAVFGSRTLVPGDALKGGMPFYKYVGNRILTAVQNRLLGTKLSELQSGYRVYSVAAIKALPFDRNTNVFHFDHHPARDRGQAHRGNPDTHLLW